MFLFVWDGFLWGDEDRVLENGVPYRFSFSVVELTYFENGGL